jgi:hypothetical protein
MITIVDPTGLIALVLAVRANAELIPSTIQGPPALPVTTQEPRLTGQPALSAACSVAALALYAIDAVV